MIRMAHCILGLALTLTLFLIGCGQATKPEKVADKTGGPNTEKKTDSPENPEKKESKVAETYTNSIGMKFVKIPAGSFIMGSPKGETLFGGEDEKQHKVTLTKSFFMGIYPVTQEQWKAVMGEDSNTYKGAGNLPADHVTWDKCQEFVKKLKEKDNKPYRLPTEAEWEYACRAGTTTAYNTGTAITTYEANFKSNFAGKDGKPPVQRDKTTPVDTFPPNAFGLYDMHGNVMQWCQDWYGDYPTNEVTDPKGPETGKERVLRNSYFFGAAHNIRSATRFHYEPNYTDSATAIGVRIVFTAE